MAGDRTLFRSRSKRKVGEEVRLYLLSDCNKLVINFSLQKRKTGVKMVAGARRVTARAEEAEAASEAAEAGEDLGDVE